MDDEKRIVANLALCMAAKNADQHMLKKLIADGAPANLMYKTNGCYPIHYAAKAGDLKCLEVMLGQPGIDINRQVQNQGDTALHVAVKMIGLKSNGKEMCELLVSKGADVSILNGDRNGKTAFTVALDVSRGALDCNSLEYFTLQLRSKLGTSTDQNVFTAEFFKLLLNERLFLARNSLNNYQHMFRSRMSISLLPSLHLEAIVAAKNVEALRALLQFEEEHPALRLDQEDRYNLVCVSVSVQNMDVLKLLFEKYRAEVEQTDMGDGILATCINQDRPVSYAEMVTYRSRGMFSQRMSLQVLKYLLDQGCSSVVFDRSVGAWKVAAIAAACESGQENICDMVLNNIDRERVKRFNSEANSDDPNPLVSCINEKKWNLLLKLLEAGFDPSVPIVKKNWLELSTPQRRVGTALAIPEISHDLMCCLQMNLYPSTLCVTHNLLSWALVNCELNDDPADIAMLKCVVQELIKNGVNVNASCNNEMSPLLALVCSCDVKSLEPFLNMLVNAGADLSQRSECSRFLSCDLAIAAAICGDYIVLHYLMSRTPTIATDLLTDLTNFTVVTSASSFQQHSAFGNNPLFGGGFAAFGGQASANSTLTTRFLLRSMVVETVRILLPYAAKSSQLCDTVRKIDEHFAVVGHGLGVQAANILSSVNEKWTAVYEELDELDSLHHQCRVTIANTLKQRCASQRSDFNRAVDQLPLPPTLKETVAFKSASYTCERIEVTPESALQPDHELDVGLPQWQLPLIPSLSLFGQY